MLYRITQKGLDFIEEVASKDFPTDEELVAANYLKIFSLSLRDGVFDYGPTSRDEFEMVPPIALDRFERKFNFIEQVTEGDLADIYIKRQVRKKAWRDNLLNRSRYNRMGLSLPEDEEEL